MHEGKGASLASKTAPKGCPEGAVETDYGLASPGQNLPGVWLPPGNYLRDFVVFLGGAFVADGR